jgi:polysaccharide export outer membrane protein
MKSLHAAGLVLGALSLVAIPDARCQTPVIAARSITVGATVDPSTSLQPGDMLRLKIWREPDLSGEFTVDDQGMAVLPRLGETRVTGMPADQLKQQLVEEYREYLNNPSIEVTPLHRIAIVGAVRNPGMYRVEPSVTIGDVVNLAGGGTQQSKPNVIELRRGADRRQLDLKKHPEFATITLISNDQVYVPEKSWLKQNATWFVSTLIGIAGTTAYLVTR